MSKTNNIHVVLNKNKWSLFREGNKRPTLSCLTQRDAIALGKILAKRNFSQLFIHNKNGCTRKIISYKQFSQ